MGLGKGLNKGLVTLSPWPKMSVWLEAMTRLFPFLKLSTYVLNTSLCESRAE